MSDRFVRDYQQDQYNQAVREIANRPIGGGGLSSGGGGGIGNAAGWAVFFGMLGALVGAILSGVAGAVVCALLAAGTVWLLSALRGAAGSKAEGRRGFIRPVLTGAAAGAAIGAVIGLGNPANMTNAITNWVFFGVVAGAGYALLKRIRG